VSWLKKLLRPHLYALWRWTWVDEPHPWCPEDGVRAQFCNCALIEGHIAQGGGPHVFWTCEVHGLRTVLKDAAGRRYAVPLKDRG
jgi:hypothetical protein